MKTKIQNHKMPHIQHGMPITRDVITADEHGVIECDNRDADFLLRTPGWARPGEDPRQPSKDHTDHLPQAPAPYEIGGGGIIGETNRRADAILAQLSVDDRMLIETEFDAAMREAHADGIASAQAASAEQIAGIIEKAEKLAADAMLIDEQHQATRAELDALKAQLAVQPASGAEESAPTPAPAAAEPASGAEGGESEPKPADADVLAPDAKREEIIAYATRLDLKIPSRVRSANVAELRSWVESALEEKNATKV